VALKATSALWRFRSSAHRPPPLGNPSNLWLATLAWVALFNERRLMEWRGHVSPAGGEANCYPRLEGPGPYAAWLRPTSLRDTQGQFKVLAA